MKRFLSHLSPGDFFLFRGQLYLKSNSLTEEKRTYENGFSYNYFWVQSSRLRIDKHIACINVLTGDLSSFGESEIIEAVALDLTIHQGK